MKFLDGSQLILSPGSGGGKQTGHRSLRSRRAGNWDVGRRRLVGSGLVATPLRQWKSRERVSAGDFVPAAEVSVSARKIAARVWQFAATAGGARWRDGLFHRLGFKFHSSLKTPKYATEEATKWERGHLEVQIATSSVASALQVQLVQARNRIKELEAKRRFSRMKLECFKMNLDEERASWIRRERQKMRVTIERLKERAIREKGKFQKMDILNSKLLSYLADSKKSAKQLMQNYEKEKKVREFMQEACNELPKEIEKEKAEIGALKSECGRILEKVEAERKMLQIVEAWHEERVQLKLASAKMIFEEKYSEMSNVIAEIKALIGSSNVSVDVTKKNQDDIQGINELSHTPPKPDYIHTIVEDSQINIAKGRRDNCCIDVSPKDHSLSIYHISPEVKGVTRSMTNMHSTDKKTVIQAVDQNSSYILEEFTQSPNDTNTGAHISSGKPEDEHSDHHHKSRKSQSSEISSVLSRNPKRKGSSALLRTSIGGNAERLNGSSSNVSSISQERISGEGTVYGHAIVGHWCPPDPRNPHIVRGMQGCIEWRRGIRRQSPRAEGLEARLASQKMQLRSVLKQKVI